jgi:hypothetical protein
MDIEHVTVADLIEYLKTKDQKLKVAYRKYSENCLLTIDEIEEIKCCTPREDGWVHNARPDMPLETYLIFPGN